MENAGGLGGLALCLSTVLVLGGGKADGDTFTLMSCDSPSASHWPNLFVCVFCSMESNILECHPCCV